MARANAQRRKRDRKPMGIGLIPTGLELGATPLSQHVEPCRQPYGVSAVVLIALILCIAAKVVKCQIRPLADCHSITSSARALTAGGISRPIAFAVLRLSTNSNLVDRTTGRSAGLSPLRIRPA